MMTRKLAVAAIAAAAIALEAAFLHAAVAAPLANALGNFEAGTNGTTVVETATAAAPVAPALAERS